MKSEELLVSLSIFGKERAECELVELKGARRYNILRSPGGALSVSVIQE